MKMVASSPTGRKLYGRRKCSLRAISPFPSVFKRLVLHTCKNQGLFRKGLNISHIAVYNLTMGLLFNFVIRFSVKVNLFSGIEKEGFENIVMGLCNTVLSAYTLYRHLE